MERDINDLLSRRVSPSSEILAAALLAVRENYLPKVARGAAHRARGSASRAPRRGTAPWWPPSSRGWEAHLRVALLPPDRRPGRGAGPGRELRPRRSRFRGLALYREDDPVTSETCRAVRQPLPLRIAEVAGETVAYGFLCGRDYRDPALRARNRAGFDLLGAREAAPAHRAPGHAALAASARRRQTASGCRRRCTCTRAAALGAVLRGAGHPVPASGA